jgi:methylmalonyl-CoA epimerase
MAVEIDHLGIAVRSLEEGLRFYRHILGMTVAYTETVEVENVNVAILPAGAHVNSPRIELLEAVGADSAIAKFIEKRGPGLHHIALRVGNLAEALDRVREEGGRVLNEPRPGAGGHQYSFVHPAAAGGVLVELIQKEETV